MSELQRWSAEDATPEERRLLESSRAEHPDPAARDRTLLALGIGAPPSGGAAPGQGGSGASGAAGPAGAAGAIGGSTKLSLVKLLVLGAAALALGAAIVSAVSRVRGTGERAQSPPAVQVSAREPSSAAPAVPLAEAPSREAPSLAPPVTLLKPARAAHRIARAAREERAGLPSLEPSLAEEVSALDRARTSLAGGDAGAALRSLDEYRARFAHGRLAAEEIVLRVQALLARGDRAGAAAVERRFSQAHPDSPYVARLRALVGAEKVIASPAAGQGPGQEATR